MSGGSGWGSGSGGHIPPGHGPGRAGGGGSGGSGGVFFPLTRSWAVGIVVYLIAGYLVSRGLVEMLATEERLDVFTWRLGLLHVPAVVTTVLTVLSAARVLPEEQRESRPLYLSAALGVPLGALCYGYAMSWQVSNAEGVVMPLVALATGAAVGLAVDRLMEDSDTEASPATPYSWRDGGATVTEYLGVIILTAAIVAALITTGAGGSIATRFRCAIGSVIGSGGSCAAGGGGDPAAKPKTDADYEPDQCQISSISDTVGDKVKIGWFEWGNEYGFKQEVSQAKTDVNEDGKVDDKDKVVTMTFTDAASIGASAKAGGKMGKLGKAEVDVGGGIKITNGDTWVFNSEEDAAKMRDDIEEMKMWETSTKYSGAYGGGWYSGMKWAEKKEDVENKIGDKKISYSTIGLNAYADGGLSISAGDESALSAKLGGKAQFSPDVTITKDDISGNESYTYSAKLELEATASGTAGPLTGSLGGKQSRTGSMTVTRDQKTGKIVRIDMTQTVENSGKGTGKVEEGGDNGKKDKDKRGGKGGISDSSTESGIEITSNSIVFGKDTDQATEAKRAIAEQWLDGSGDNTAPFAYMFGDHSLQEKPAGSDPFEQMMFQDGLSTDMKYHGETDAQEFGFELSLGMSIGLTVTDEHKKETLTDAQFLGAPQDGKRTYLPYSYCAN
ncbi:hypothetical protein OG782_24165 [Streptomyces sp. NBC_00876]|uniref:hypothetical protein n=1 Tax=Streptomyces sp. NBC_00876 TaxID=2975853 RepID=UPI00386768D8|nr:hypothetical protein OG782_24165 [Streptomyces sp. NBC_00876]